MFILLADNQAIGTAFAFKSKGRRYICTAAHCVCSSEELINSNYSIALSVATSDKSDSYTINGQRPVEYACHDLANDWAVFKLKDEDASFAEIDCLPICRHIPDLRDEERFKLYHCPVSSLDKHGSVSPIPIDWIKPSGLNYLTGHIFFPATTLVRGSSGGVVINKLGEAIAIDLECENSIRTVAESKDVLQKLKKEVVRNKKMKTEEWLRDTLSEVSSSIDTAAHSHGSESKCIILCTQAEFMTYVDV